MICPAVNTAGGEGGGGVYTHPLLPKLLNNKLYRIYNQKQGEKKAKWPAFSSKELPSPPTPKKSIPDTLGGGCQGTIAGTQSHPTSNFERDKQMSEGGWGYRGGGGVE